MKGAEGAPTNQSAKPMPMVAPMAHQINRKIFLRV
jgi:hypothetical protein